MTPSGTDENLSDTNTPAHVNERNPHAVALGRLGGLKGGKARWALLSPEERSAQARKLIEARWAKNKDQKKEQE